MLRFFAEQSLWHDGGYRSLTFCRVLVHHTLWCVCCTYFRQHTNQLAAVVKAETVVVVNDLCFLLHRTIYHDMLWHTWCLIAFVRVDMFNLSAVGVRRGVQRNSWEDKRVSCHEHHNGSRNKEPSVPSLSQQMFFIQLFSLLLHVPIHCIFPALKFI